MAEVKEKNIFLVYVRKCCSFTNDYRLIVYKVTTDNIYRVIGKIVCTTLAHIRRIYFDSWSQSREDFWIKEGFEIVNYQEPCLSYD